MVGRVDMNSGRKVSSEVTLWDAFFPGLLALSGDLDRARRSDEAWDLLWSKHGVIPMVYDYDKDQIVNPYYQLNPEVMESAYYLWHYTGDTRYLKNVERYYANIKEHCRTEIAYCHIEDVRTMKKADEMETFFIAETLKYCYLTFDKGNRVNPDDYVFSTEAHPFRKSDFQRSKVILNLGLGDQGGWLVRGGRAASFAAPNAIGKIPDQFEGAGTGTVETLWLNEASRVTVCPFAPVVVTVLVPFPFTTEVSTVRSIVLPFAVVMTSLLSQAPGATFVSVEV